MSEQMPTLPGLERTSTAGAFTAAVESALEDAREAGAAWTADPVDLASLRVAAATVDAAQRSGAPRAVIAALRAFRELWHDVTRPPAPTGPTIADPSSGLADFLAGLDPHADDDDEAGDDVTYRETLAVEAAGLDALAAGAP